MYRTIHNLILADSSGPRQDGRCAGLVPSAALIVLLAMPGMAPAQGIPGVDPVKVKTIPIAPKGGSATPTASSPGATAPPAPTSDLPAPVKVRTLRIDRDGHVLHEAPTDKPNSGQTR